MATAHRNAVGLGLAVACVVVLASSGTTSAQSGQTYIVLYNGNTVPAAAAEAIAASGGTLVDVSAPVTLSE
jgi:hypothetical protein